MAVTAPATNEPTPRKNEWFDAVNVDLTALDAADVAEAAARAAAIETLVSDLSGKQPLDSDLSTIAGLTPSNDDVLQRKSGAWINRTVAQHVLDLAAGGVARKIRDDAYRAGLHAPHGAVRINSRDLRASHATTPSTTPTYDGSGQTVHPSIYYDPLGWNGYKFWMGITPYPGGDTAYEQPSILASNDGDSWVVPAGLVNPIDAPATGFYPDPDLNMVDGTLWCVYNTGPFHAKFSTDGVNWSARQTLTLPAEIPSGVSPTIARRGDEFYFWVVDSTVNPNVLRVAKASNILGPYTYLGAATFTPIAGRDVWHIEVSIIGDQFVAAWDTCTADVSGSAAALHIATSLDGLTWDLNPRSLLAPLVGAAAQSLNIYRSSLVPLDGRGGRLFDLHYSASDAVPTWRTFRTTVFYKPLEAKDPRHALTPQQTGRHYPPTFTQLQRTAALTVGSLFSAPCFTDKDIYVDEFAVNVFTAGGAGSLHRMGIYLPGNPDDPFSRALAYSLLIDGGTVDCTTTGIKTLAVTATLIRAGWFFVCGVSQVAAPTLYIAGSTTGTPYFHPMGQSTGGMSAAPLLAWTNAGITGALPASLVMGAASNNDAGVTYRRSA